MSRSILIFAFTLILKAYPKDYQGTDSEEMIEDFIVNDERAAREEGPLSIWEVRKRYSREFLGGLFAERRPGCARFVNALAAPHRLTTFGGAAALIIGVSSAADGITSWLSMALFLQYPYLPHDAPLGIFRNPIIIAFLSVLGCAGIHSIVGRQSRLAYIGMCLAGASVGLAAFLFFYDWAVTPAYHMDGGFGLQEGQKEVDYFAKSILQLRSYYLSFATLFMSIVAFRSPRLGKWWVILLVLSFCQSPLLARSAFYLFRYVMLSGVSSFELMLLRDQVLEILFYIPDIVPGLTWSVVGYLMISRSAGLRRKPPTTSETSELYEANH